MVDHEEVTDFADPDSLANRVRDLRSRSGQGDRVLVGIAGKPGSGKSTLSAAVADRLGPTAVVVPMDGFHLADVVLERLGLIDRKGAPETFDPYGFTALLARLRREPGPVFAPGFERTLEQPVAQAVMVEPDHRVVITEGNYLLLDDPAWVGVRQLLDEVWWLDADEQLRIERLRRRHLQFGKSSSATDAWMATVDGPNADLVGPTARRADLELAAIE